MQLAALAAVISHFWRHVSDLLFGSLSAIGRRDFSDRSLKLAFGIAIGTVPIGVAGLALAKLLNTCTPRSAASKSSVSLASSWRCCSALPS